MWHLAIEKTTIANATLMAMHGTGMGDSVLGGFYWRASWQEFLLRAATLYCWCISANWIQL